MNATLSTLWPDSMKPRLIEAVQKRTSCRNFSGAPDSRQQAALHYCVGRCKLPGVRIAFIPVNDGVFTAPLMMRSIAGCRLAAAVIIDETPHARLHAGIMGEALVLEATALGLGSCWVSGSYRRKAVSVALNRGEELLCLIALGVPSIPLAAPAKRTRKPPEHFCKGDFRQWPEMLQSAAALVQQSPSAMNMQPWALFMGRNGEFVVDASDRAELDVGIALCHAELALDIPHEWYFGQHKSEPMAWAVAK